ncbi:MAG: endopeptidase La [Cytophagales bacterium]|nr:endopeptidase La [Cytophaga sp.]
MLESEPVDMIPLITPEEEAEMDKEEFPGVLPILPVRNIVLFPGVVLPITVGRQKSIRLVKKYYKGDRIIGVVAQENQKAEEPGFQDIFKTGTVAKILRMFVLPDGNTTIIIQGKRRFKIEEQLQEEPFMQAKVSMLKDIHPNVSKKEIKVLIQSVKESATKILKMNPEIPQDAQIAINNIESANFLTHFLSSNINADLKDKQKLLEFDDAVERATWLLQLMDKDIQMLEIKREIHTKVHTDIDQQQRDYFLRQQIKVLQDELGDFSSEQEFEKLKEKASAKKWSDKVRQHFDKEMSKLQRVNPMAPDYPVTFNYLELLVELPWNENSKDNFDLIRAKKVLDEDHFGLIKVKQRILEYLAVLKLKNNMNAPILCLYGPPGVGKTSLGKSIAKALDRKYIRMSLGGVHDESEIRGHRKTYIGAMPGKIIQGIKRSESSNPVFILDEIDKVSKDFRGDPSSALLEVLDPEQNSTFIDNYLEVEYDLSKVLFVATSNSLDTIQPALRDRMEIIEINGYTLEEKIQIAKKYLIPKQKEEHGLKVKDISFTDDAIVKIIEDYTRESGVRNLERKIGAVVRNIAVALATEVAYVKKIQPAQVREILGSEDFEKDAYQHDELAGIVTGLAWTPYGGEILTIESILSKGKGKLTLSGQLGDVMKESATAALSLLKANVDAIGIDYRVFDHFDLHIHVPAGATPKDGPSAGIALYTSLASTFTQRKIKTALAMTGEITLRGKVLPVGGIKEKILAARRAGIKEIILSKKNKKDIDEIHAPDIADLKFHFVETADEVLAIALLKQKIKKPFNIQIPDDSKKESKK